MTNRKKTLEILSYGLSNPQQLFEKLRADSAKLGSEQHPYDVFNFVVTAAVLAEWTQKYYGTAGPQGPFASPSGEGNEWVIPSQAASWIHDTTCLPNPALAERYIKRALAVCAHVANASKHYYWADKGHIESICPEPPISSWYQYFFTARTPDIYVTIQGENYGLKQIQSILLQFYDGLLASLSGNDADSAV
jgi:hypothetical protein